MTEGPVRMTRWDHALLAADGFLFAAAADITLTALLLAVLFLAFGDAESVSVALGPALGSLLSMGMTVIAVFAGAVLAWSLHGRAVGWPLAAGMLGGVIVGMALSMPLFIGAAMLFSRLPVRTADGPPWFAIGVLGVLAGAVLLVPVVDAARDWNPRRRAHLRLDLARTIALLVVVALALIVLPLVGAMQNSELGEAGIFMVPFAAAGAFAVIGGDALDAWRHRPPRDAGVAAT